MSIRCTGCPECSWLMINCNTQGIKKWQMIFETDDVEDVMQESFIIAGLVINNKQVPRK